MKAALLYYFGDLGVSPKDAPFALLASITQHYWRGSYYPVGGPSEIAYRIIPVIEKAGGRVLVRANVKSIDIASGAVKGVTLMRGNQEFKVILQSCLLVWKNIHSKFFYSLASDYALNMLSDL